MPSFVRALRTRLSRSANPAFAVVIVGALVAVPVLGADNPKLRNWKDSSGSFEIKAELVGESNGTVTLRQEDGEELEIELEKLSTLDQNFVKNQKKTASPFKKKGAASSPFRTKSAPASEPTEEPAFEPSAGGKIISVDWSSAKLVQPAEQSNWEAIKIDAPDVKKTWKSMQLPKKRDFFEKLTGFVVGPQTAVIGYKLESRGAGEPTATTRLVTCDPVAGKSSSVVVDGNFALLDVSPVNGALLVKKDVWGFGNQDEVEIWRVNGKTVDRQAVCTPFAGEEGPSKDVKWGAFVDENHVAVLGGWGKFGVFDIGSGAGDYMATYTNQTSIALSPDRKFAAIATGKDLQIVNALTGEGLATIPTSPQGLTGLAFSSDGKRLCLQNGELLTTWNLTDGSLYREVVLSGLNYNGTVPPVWTSPTHVLAGGGSLIDMETFVRLWQYNGAEAVTTAGDQTLFCVGAHNEAGAIVAMKLPHEGAVKMLKAAMTDPSFFVVSPGMAVRVDVSGIGDAGQQKKARDALSGRLAAAGMKVADNAAITLRAAIENAGNEEVTYRSFGGGFGEKTVSVTKYVSKLEYLVGGKAAWQTAVTATPHFLNRSEDESIEQAVRKANQPNYAFFESAAIPTYVMKPTGQATLGASIVTANGLR